MLIQSATTTFKFKACFTPSTINLTEGFSNSPPKKSENMDVVWVAKPLSSVLIFAKKSRLVFRPTSPFICGTSIREAIEDVEDVESLLSKDCFLVSSGGSLDSVDSPKDWKHEKSRKLFGIWNRDLADVQSFHYDDFYSDYIHFASPVSL